MNSAAQLVRKAPLLKRLAWLTGVHLNCLAPDEAEALYGSLTETDADTFLMTGEFGVAPNVA